MRACKPKQEGDASIDFCGTGGAVGGPGPVLVSRIWKNGKFQAAGELRNAVKLLHDRTMYKLTHQSRVRMSEAFKEHSVNAYHAPSTIQSRKSRILLHAWSDDEEVLLSFQTSDSTQVKGDGFWVMHALDAAVSSKKKSDQHPLSQVTHVIPQNEHLIALRMTMVGAAAEVAFTLHARSGAVFAGPNPR
jgi:hypothetical protein